MSSDEEFTEHPQGSHTREENLSTFTKRKKRVQFLEDEENSESFNAGTKNRQHHRHKKSKLSSEKYQQKEFLESVLFDSGGSTDTDDNQPIVISDSPAKDKQHKHNTSSTVGIEKDDSTTIDRYNRNILNKMDFSESDDLDDFIEHDEPMVTGSREIIQNKRVPSSTFVDQRYNQYDSQFDRAQQNNDRSYRLALDVFGDDFMADTYTQPIVDEPVSDDSAKLFGDDDSVMGDRIDYSQSTTTYDQRNVVHKSIHELFEPDELKRQYLTSFDDTIRNKDVPERFQLRSNAVKPADTEELEKEARWIYDNFIGNSALLLTNEKRQSSTSSLAGEPEKIAPYDHISYIKVALDLIRNELCEVPFILMYRHENINGALNEDQLWAIYKADNKWCSFSNKIKQFSGYLQRFQSFQQSSRAANLKFSYNISDRDFRYLETINSEVEFFHFFKKIQFYNGTYKNDFLFYERNAEDQAAINSETANVEVAPQKEPRSFNRHYFYMTKEIDKVVSCFGLSSAQFDENVQMEYQRHNPMCSLESPTCVAEKYLSNVFDSGEKVIEAAVDMFTLELSHEQHILRYVHQLFLKHARLDVSPTKNGIEQIDESHPYCSFKYIVNKPIKGITSEMMIKLEEARTEKLLDVSIGLPEHIVSEMIDYLKSFQSYSSNGGESHSKFDKEWSGLRCTAIEKTVHNYFLPIVEKDLYRQLLREAQHDLVKRCGDVFKNHLIHSPFAAKLRTMHSMSESNIDSDPPYIMVVSVPPPSFTNTSATANTNGKRKPKYFHMKAINGRINHPSFIGQTTSSHNFDDNIDSDQSRSTSSYPASNVVGVTNDDIGYVIVMDDCGECIDYVTVNNSILHFKASTSSQQQRQQMYNLNDSKLNFSEVSFGKIEKILSKYKIGAVFVPLIDRQYKYFAENLKIKIQSMCDNSNVSRAPSVHLVNPYISDRLMKVMLRQDSTCANRIEYHRAVSIGRYVLDPLVECANLFVGDFESLTFLNDLLPPYQKYLEVDKLRAVFEEKLVSIVNEIGVDLNKACGVSWYSSLLQFVCGFGARKAHRLLTDIRSSSETGRLTNRTQLVTMCNLGPKIFINCAGFLKIEGFSDDIGDVELLDATRIHPELYDWTRKIMIDALDMEDPNNIDSIDTTKKYDFNEMLTTLRNDPSKLKELDLDVFANELMRQGVPLNKKYSLELITTEMLNDFPDYRPPFTELTDPEKFWILTNGGSRVDICETLEYNTVSGKHPSSDLSRFHNEDLIPVYPGKYVWFVATRFICKRPDQEEISKAVPERDMDSQMWKCPFCFDHISTDLKICWDHIENVCPGNAVAVSGFLEGFYGAITGVISLVHVSDNPPKNIKERIRKSMHITCMVLNLKFNLLSVDLTCRSSDLVDKPNNCYKFKRDAYYDKKAEEQQRQVKKDKKEELKKQVVYQKKVIIHPSFKNVTFTEAEKLLESAPAGDCIIRPSSKGADHLTVTWKVYDNIYHHIDIVEKDKPNFFSLGKKLWIKGECYDDLDEIIARHIEPMSALMKEASTLKVFNYAEGGSRHKMASILSEEKKASPLRIPYVFSPSKIYPGKLLLGFLPRNTPLFEYVSVVPEGVKFRDIIHPSFNDLIRWFKLNFNQSNLNSTYPNNTSTAAGGSLANKTPNAYHTTSDKSSFDGDGSVSPLTGGINKKIGFKTTPQVSSISSRNPVTGSHSYISSGGGLSKKSARYIFLVFIMLTPFIIVDVFSDPILM